MFGGGTVTTTKTITATSSTGTGYQLNVTFTGTPLENVLLTAIQVTTAGALTEFDIDNFNFTVVNTLPTIEVVDASNVAITNGGVAATGNNTDFGVACINAGTVYARCTVSGCASVASPIVSVNVITPLSASPGNVNITWTGAINTDWNTACNWSPAWVSDASNNQVIIPSVANQPIIDATTTAIIKVIYINGTLTINNGGILNVRGNGGIDAEISVYGTLSNSGSVRLETAGAGTLSGHGISIWNNATVTKYHCLWWIFGTEDDLINRNFRINISILNGEIGDLYTTLDNIRHIVTFNGSSTSTVLDGFTITGGNANFDSKNIVFYLLAPITEPLSRVGGITVENAGNPVIINCIFVSNSAVTGGGLFTGDNSKPTITGCKFMGNLASFGAGMYFQDGSHAKVDNTLISGNRSIGAIYNNYSNPIITNCSFGGNGLYSGIFNSNSHPVMKNSIVWGNAMPFNDTQTTISYSTIQGGYAGVGNLSMDPKFVSLTPEGLSPNLSGDYHVQASSLTIDRGDNGATNLTDKDLDGNLRKFSGGRVDMGTYVFQGTATATLVISLATGNWESNSTSDIGRVPQLGDYVIIDNNHVVTLSTIGIAKNLEYRGTG